MPDTLQNGQNFEDFHKEQAKKYVGFRSNHRGTNFDKYTRFIDSLVFSVHQDLDEQDKAHSIDYAHGLELDDIGDNFDIARNGLDDETYRFLLKSHQLSMYSQGTWDDIKNIAAALLGCQPQDVDIHNSREYKDGILQDGDPNTILLTDIDVTKITHANLLPMIADQLQIAMAAGYRIKQIGFGLGVNVDTYVGMGMQSHAEMDLSIPPYVEVKQPMSMTVSTGVGLKLDYYVQI